MDNQKKALSFRDRLNIEPGIVSVKKHEKRILSKTSVVDELTGRVLNKTEYATLDNNKYLSRFRVNDFSVETLEAVGHLKDSIPTALSHDVHTSQSIIENTLTNSKTFNQ